MTTKAFYKSIQFTFIKTWSFHSGPKLEDFIQKKEHEIALKQEAISNARYMQLPKLNAQMELLKQEKDMYNFGIFDDHGNLNQSAVETATIKFGSTEADALGRIFATPARQLVASSCIPVYRDAIVFYNEHNEVQHVLDICFECLFLRVNGNEFLTAGFSFYRKLSLFLSSFDEDIASE